MGYKVCRNTTTLVQMKKNSQILILQMKITGLPLFTCHGKFDISEICSRRRVVKENEFVTVSFLRQESPLGILTGHSDPPHP